MLNMHQKQTLRRCMIFIMRLLRDVIICLAVSTTLLYLATLVPKYLYQEDEPSFGDTETKILDTETCDSGVDTDSYLEIVKKAIEIKNNRKK